MILIGHRGCSYPGYNQNTLRAFRKVIEQGVSAIELDVQRCSDGALPIVHNLDLKMVSTGDGKVSSTESAALRKLYAGDPSRSRDRIPFLEEVLDLFSSLEKQNRPMIQLELKGKATGKPSGELICSYLESGKLTADDVLVSSFNWRELAELGKVCPDLRIALLDGAIRRENLMKRLPGSSAYYTELFAYGEEDYMLPRFKNMLENEELLEKLVPPGKIRDGLRQEIEDCLTGKYYSESLLEAAGKMKAVSVNLWYLSVRQDFIEKAHAEGLKVLLYTINSPEELISAAKMGADGVFTDFFETSREILRKEGIPED